VLEQEVASAQLLGRSPDLQVVGVGAGRPGVDVGRVDRLYGRGRNAGDVAGVTGLVLLETPGTALGLALLGALAVTRHASACLFVRGVLPAPAAVLAKLNPIRVVPLRLLGLIVTPFAVLACEGYGDSDVSASHGSFGR
jgi:hypothetical protein